jgi:hypothetical protein
VTATPERVRILAPPNVAVSGSPRQTRLPNAVMTGTGRRSGIGIDASAHRDRRIGASAGDARANAMRWRVRANGCQPLTIAATMQGAGVLNRAGFATGGLVHVMQR